MPLSFAESALESESEEHQAGPWEFTPSHLDDFDGLYDPDFGSDDDFDFDNPHATTGSTSDRRGAPRRPPPLPPGVIHCVTH
jgi:hypothetical protein